MKKQVKKTKVLVKDQLKKIKGGIIIVDTGQG